MNILSQFMYLICDTLVHRYKHFLYKIIQICYVDLIMYETKLPVPLYLTVRRTVKYQLFWAFLTFKLKT